MPDEWIDAEWIRQRLNLSGRSQRDFAAALGIDPSGVSRLLDGRRKLKVAEIPAARAFFDYVPSDTGRPGSSDENAECPCFLAHHPKSRIRPGQIPVYAVVGAVAPWHFTILSALPAEQRPIPSQLLGVNGAFGIFIPDDAMAPRLRAGEVVYIHPNKPPVIGADVLVNLRAHGDRFALLRYQGAEGGLLNFSPISDVGVKESVRLERDEVAQFGRIALIAME